MADPVAMAGLFFMLVPVYQQCICEPVCCPVVTAISWPFIAAICWFVDHKRDIRFLDPVVYEVVDTEQHIGYIGNYISIVVFIVFACFKAGR